MTVVKVIESGGKHRRSGAFTLIEVIVVIFIIGLLAALVLTSISSARAASRRVACGNNLRQLGLAFQSYQATNRFFPPGISFNGYSFHSRLLPYLDNTPVYNAMNFQVSVRQSRKLGDMNYTVAHLTIGVFLCPSDPYAIEGRSFNSYAGNRGTGVQAFGYNGAFPFELTGLIGPEGFRDGTSSTVAVSEWLGGTRLGEKSIPSRTVFHTLRAIVGKSELDLFADTCHSLDLGTAKQAFLSKGSTWVVGELSYTLYNHVLGINDKSCLNESLVQEGAWTAGSLHSEGVNTTFADGHVQFIKASVAKNVWRAIASRDGGEVAAEGF